MAKKDDETLLETEDQEAVVVITDEKGNETYYLEEMVIPMDSKNFALLTQIPENDDTDPDDEANVIIARVDFDENGDPVYLDPTDEEFEAVRKASEEIMDEMDAQSTGRSIMRKKLLPIGILLILALLGGGYWYLDYYNTNTSLATGQKVRFTVTHGMTTGDIATLLYNKKLIQTPDSFRMAARLKGLENHLQAGTYEITAGMSDGEIINILSKGKVHSNRFAVPEGATVNEVALKLEREHLTTAQEFKDACRNYAPYPYMQTSNPDVVYKAEGFLCPATYDFPENAKASDMVAMMVKEFDKKLTPDLRTDIRKSYLSLRDIVNLASMVEREATHKEEMPLIAGVFEKRMQMGMPIQSDTTIQYILGAQKKEVTYDDLELESPYNTYLNKGLPPGPVGNPSMDAIRAVIHPVMTDYLYFVADKEGYHHFTKTYEEHVAMIQKLNPGEVIGEAQ